MLSAAVSASSFLLSAPALTLVAFVSGVYHSDRGSKLKHLANSSFEILLWSFFPCVFVNWVLSWVVILVILEYSSHELAGLSGALALTQNDESSGGNCEPTSLSIMRNRISLQGEPLLPGKDPERQVLKEALSLSISDKSCLEFQPSSTFLLCSLLCHRG